jgi:hypothetical protein
MLPNAITSRFVLFFCIFTNKHIRVLQRNAHPVTLSPERLAAQIYLQRLFHLFQYILDLDSVKWLVACCSNLH